MVELHINRAGREVVCVFHNSSFGSVKGEYESNTKRRVTDSEFKKLLSKIPVIHVVENGLKNDWIERFTFGGK